MVIYLDLLMLTNFLLDYISLRAASALSGCQLKRARLALAALGGAVYAGAACFGGLEFLASLPVKIIAGVALAAGAFGINRRFPARCAVFFAVSAAFAGIVTALSSVSEAADTPNGFAYLNISLPVLVGASAGAYAVFSLLASVKARFLASGQKSMTAEVTLKGKTAVFPVLVDTGCALSDPLTNRPVLIAGIDALDPLLPPEVRARLERREDAADVIEGCREHLLMSPVFYKTLDGGGMLAAFLPDRLTLNGSEQKGIKIAISPWLSREDGACAVIMPF